LLLRSSGSSGRPKTIVHSVHRLLRKFERPRTGYRTVAFLLFDHIGGIDTLFVTLANGGCLIMPEGRSPDHVAAAVARHRAEVLPASPTFLNLLLLSGAHDRHDLGSLRIITYGTEVMPASVLERLTTALPGVQLIQKFGMSELGTLRSRSQASDSPWVTVGGDGVQWRVADGLLEIRSDTAMLGYLDAPSPFTEDGWLRTGDAVEVDGAYLRFLGRRSEIINVGGLKVYPAEVESVLLQAPDVLEATVSGEANPLIGTLVKAVVRVAGDEGDADARARLRRHCREHLQPYQVPQRLDVTREALHTARFKTKRQGD
jgi:acyl-coenzyme A synthetase/AMP-(fatty) acid ligase